jgi:DNA topoisomerase-1
MKKLLIVESPTKAKTISRFLDTSFSIESSFGHIRDLPKSIMGIDVEHDFEPKYIIPKEKTKRVNELKKMAKSADTIYFATDHDREGEAISWHLAQIFGVDPKGAKRITFDEITKKAILSALENPRSIDLSLVDAQQARRVLDRLVGYELSPFLWRKLMKGLSAGRVQSVAVRLVVEREREIQAFQPKEYWTIDALFSKEKERSTQLTTRLFQMNGETLDKFALANEEKIKEILSAISANNGYNVAKIGRKEKHNTPPPPLTTSTLQQSANNRLGFSAKRTMMLAQKLYEGVEIPDEGSMGLITYMRTDSVNLSDEFLKNAHEYIITTFGTEYAASEPRKYTTKSKGAQEAHEAIRPTDINRIPEGIKASLDPALYKLYKIIWERACASQMSEAVFDETNIFIDNENRQFTFKAAGSIIRFDGFLKVLHREVKENILPEIAEGERMKLESVTPLQHFTEPPGRYTEASLVKALEKYGIGRPSTYAPTLATIQERNYVIKEQKQLKPTEIAMKVSDLLTAHFPEVVDYQFTAQMEEKLDDIAEGKTGWKPMIAEFYKKFKENLDRKQKEISKKEITEEPSDETCEKCGSAMVIKMGRFGRFLACTKFPECKNTKKLRKEGEEPTKETAPLEEKCPECSANLEVKHGRFGEFIGCSAYPTCKFIKNIDQGTGVKCPGCNEGEIVQKRSKRGKIFFSCNRYPDCKFALWDKPNGEKCEKCGSLLVEKKSQTVCSNKECKKT